MSSSIREKLGEIFRLIGDGKTVDAVERCQYEIAATDEKDAAPFLFMLAMISFYNHDEGLGLQLLERAHQIDPNCREYVEALANMCTRLGHLTDGLYYAKLAVALRPNSLLAGLIPQEMSSYRASLGQVGISLHNMKAEAAFRLGNFDEAIDQAALELRINPQNIDTMAVIAEAMMAKGECHSAAAILKGALHVQPRSARLHVLLGEALIGSGRHDEAVGQFDLALDLMDEDDDTLLARMAGSVARQSDNNWPAAQKIIERHMEECRNPLRAARTEPAPQGLIGILWDQCHEGPLLDFMLPVIRPIQSTVLYNLSVRKDVYSETLRNAVTRPRISIGIDISTLARIMQGDGLECVFNFCAPREDAAFPLFFGDARPITVHWINLPMTDRLPNADIVISGPQTRDIDERNYGAENVIAVDALVAYAFPQSVPPEEELSPLPREDRGFTTFGLYGDASRITLDTVTLVARALLATHNSRLLIGGRFEWESEFISRMADLFGGFGLSDRIHFQEANPAASDSRIDFFHQIDILLDTAPVSGHLDVVKALWMGVPVVTLRGARRAGRFAASILDAAGKASWIAADAGDYARIARDLAESRSLADLRQNLRTTVLASPLANTNQVAQSLVDGIRQWIDAHRQGAPS